MYIASIMNDEQDMEELKIRTMKNNEKKTLEKQPFTYCKDIGPNMINSSYWTV